MINKPRGLPKANQSKKRQFRQTIKKGFTMKTSVTFSDFCDAFHDTGRNENFSYAGKRALFDYLEQYEEDTGEELELDVVALCCEYYENDLDSVISDYSIDVSEVEDDDEKADIVEEYLNDNTFLVARMGTDFLYQAF